MPESKPGWHDVEFHITGSTERIVTEQFEVLESEPKPTKDVTLITVKGAAWCSPYPLPGIKLGFTRENCDKVTMTISNPKYKYDDYAGVSHGITPAEKLGRWISDSDPGSAALAEGAEFTFNRVPVPNSWNPAEEVEATLTAYKSGSVTGTKGFTCTTKVKISRIANPYMLGAPYGANAPVLEGPWGFATPATPGWPGCQTE